MAQRASQIEEEWRGSDIFYDTTAGERSSAAGWLGMRRGGTWMGRERILYNAQEMIERAYQYQVAGTREENDQSSIW